jgi:translation initiation factor 2 gamma subunit (eIF-2gamma)
MSNKQIFEFNVGELDILAFDPANIPGDHIKARIVTSDSNLTEVVQNITVDDKQMYKHTVTLRNQIKLENGKVYMFKVRDNTDTGKLIAYAKDTGPLNLVNSNGEYTIEDGDVYFNWNEANKYIVQGNKTIYFELNGIKL